MPLQDLVEYFNQRITEEQGLKDPPLVVRAGKVDSRFGGLRLATEFHPIRWAESPSVIVGHDATLQAFQPETSESTAVKVFHTADVNGVINRDRLCRTIHMLNYLPIAHQDGYLFLHVHPRHVLGVKSDHGAYFEEVIFRCGLSPRRVVISVAVTPVYEGQFNLLFKGLKNYQNRGYATAVKFDGNADPTSLERYCLDFLYRITPDFVRMEAGFLSRLKTSREAGRRNNSLLSVVHTLDTQLLLEDIKEWKDHETAHELRAAFVKGEYYESPNVDSNELMSAFRKSA